MFLVRLLSIILIGIVFGVPMYLFGLCLGFIVKRIDKAVDARKLKKRGLYEKDTL